jgi:hypothetical protein
MIEDTIRTDLKANSKKDDKGCWIWQRSINTSGYGQAYDRRIKKGVRAHRLSYEMFTGLIPEGLALDHLCRVRACINPAHLEPCTTKENVLRGISVAAENARKTSCMRGHPFTDGNYTVTNGTRQCYECKRIRDKVTRKKLSDQPGYVIKPQTRKLTAELADTIRNDTEHTARELAEQYSVNKQTILDIKNGKTWTKA